MSTHAADGLTVWASWKRVNELMRTRIFADVLASSPLSESETTLLVLLSDAAGMARQNALAAATGWDRSRLSHLLTRMEQRGYVTRERIRNGAIVAITAAGAEAYEATREPYEQAVYRHVTSRLDSHELAVLDAILARLSE